MVHHFFLSTRYCFSNHSKATGLDSLLFTIWFHWRVQLASEYGKFIKKNTHKLGRKNTKVTFAMSETKELNADEVREWYSLRKLSKAAQCTRFIDLDKRKTTYGLSKEAKTKLESLEHAYTTEYVLNNVLPHVLRLHELGYSLEVICQLTAAVLDELSRKPELDRNDCIRLMNQCGMLK